MKQVTIYNLQKNLSKVIKEVEAGDVYEIQRYSKSSAVLLSTKSFKELASGKECKECVKDLRKITKKLKDNNTIM